MHKVASHRLCGGPWVHNISSDCRLFGVVKKFANGGWRSVGDTLYRHKMAMVVVHNPQPPQWYTQPSAPHIATLPQHNHNGTHNHHSGTQPTHNHHSGTQRYTLVHSGKQPPPTPTTVVRTITHNTTKVVDTTTGGSGRSLDGDSFSSHLGNLLQIE